MSCISIITHLLMESLTDSRTCLIAIEIIEEEQDQPEESHDMDINFTQLEQALEQRRRLKLLLISLTFIISICFISYSVVADIKSQKGESLNLCEKYFDFVFAQVCCCWKK